MFEMGDEQNKDFIFSVTINNNVSSNISKNPYFGEISITKFQSQPYMKTKATQDGRNRKQAIGENGSKQVQICL